MQPPVTPVFDNHMHLDPRGQVEEAVKAFHRAGGTHFMLIHKPYVHEDGRRINRTLEDHAAAMDTTLALAERVRRSVPEVTVFVALSPHPAEFTKLLDDGLSIEDASTIYEQALELAQHHVLEGRAVAMAEVGRPHWDGVPDEVWDAANALMRHSFALAKQADCAVQVHAETATPESYADLADHARRAGIDPNKVVKHYSTPIVDTSLNHGLWPSVIVGKNAAESAIAQGTRFLMETDYMDDPDHPGAVMGPKTVPKRTRSLIADGTMTEEQAWTIHQTNPQRVYGIEIAL